MVPSLDEPNLREPEAVALAIRLALSEVAPRTRAVTLVLPDTLVRVFVLDFDSMPAKASEAVSVVRFRLRKMVPFDVEPAGVSCQVLSQNESECRVLAAIVPGPILRMTVGETSRFKGTKRPPPIFVDTTCRPPQRVRLFSILHCLEQFGVNLSVGISQMTRRTYSG